ncbi:MAG: HEAT repeat domain-containing protein [Bryobacteraceae bacterium]
MTFAAKLLLPLVSIAAAAAAAQPPVNQIGTIDFFGYGSLDTARLERVLPFKPRDPLPTAELRDEAEQTISRVADRPSVTVTSVCCLADGRYSVFVGMAETNAPFLSFNDRPSGDRKFPAAILDVFMKMDQYWQAAIQAGHAGEDDSQGYALLDDPDTHFQQVKIRDWARSNFQIVYKILETSRYKEQRAYAAEALGYLRRSPQQISALVQASFDADGGVRNNALRALAIVLKVAPDLAGEVPAERFIPFLYSPEWSDRNKIALLFETLTASRDRAVLGALRSEALEPLREMAQWKDWRHAQASARLLGRIAGIEETQIDKLIAFHDVEDILKAIH